MEDGQTQGKNITSRSKAKVTRDVCKTLTSRPFLMKHLPRSSPYLAHDETKSFGSIPSTHPVHDETKSFGSTPLPHPLNATAKIWNGNLQARSQTFLWGGSNRSNFGTFYDYGWIILRSRWIWSFWGGQMTPLTPPPWLRAWSISNQQF